MPSVSQEVRDGFMYVAEGDEGCVVDLGFGSAEVSRVPLGLLTLRAGGIESLGHPFRETFVVGGGQSALCVVAVDARLSVGGFLLLGSRILKASVGLGAAPRECESQLGARLPH